MVLIIVVLYVKNKFFMAIRKIIIIASAKGGVGKSTLTASLAHYLSKSSLVGILDADIYGPSQHTIFNIKDQKLKTKKINDEFFYEPIIKDGIKLSSMGFILDSQSSATWRGPMLSSALKQLIHKTEWGDIDFLLIDMPPGTGDAYLTICKELKIDLAILTSSPHELSLIDTKRSFDTMKKLGIYKYLYLINDCINSGLDSINFILSEGIESFSIPFNKDLHDFNFKNMEAQFIDIINYIKNEI